MAAIFGPIQYHRRRIILFLAIALVCFFAYWFYRKRTTSAGILNELEHNVFPIEGTKPVGIKKGLAAIGHEFYLMQKPLRILSGAIHYFRVVPEYWRDRLLKLKAMGLNTVETYVPWNLHEEIKGQFRFDGNLDLRAFIKIAQELDLFVIVRPGPYICAEWDFGGLPSFGIIFIRELTRDAAKKNMELWLLHDPNMEPRSMYRPYLDAVEQFFKKLLPLLVPLQFSNGGPIIAFQIENEYGSFKPADVEYMKFLKSLMINEGITELLFTSDNSGGLGKDLSLPDVLKTVNFGNHPDRNLQVLKEMQPNKPLMVSEYWLGWFDHWRENHHTVGADEVTSEITDILKLGASFNLYMFHGGTNFGFMNGANSFKPTVTSYDYDAALSEAGDIRPKYQALRNVLIKQHALLSDSIPNDFPPLPANIPKEAYEKVIIKHHMTLEELLQYHIPVESENVMPMEQLPINNDGGQGYGFTLYQTDLLHIPKEILIEKAFDRAQVFLDSVLIHVSDASLMAPVGKWMVKVQVDEKALNLPKVEKHILEILVENMGRTNIEWDMKFQRKGLHGQVIVDGKSQTAWKIVPLEFKADVLSRLQGNKTWNPLPKELPEGPSLYRGTFQVNSEPKDTFLHMKGWTKGVCFINGHNLGRYWNVGPLETLYVPAPWLRKGENEVIVFELHQFKAAEIPFAVSPVLGQV